jgi:hypothetical protein
MNMFSSILIAGAILTSTSFVSCGHITVETDEEYTRDKEKGVSVTIKNSQQLDFKDFDKIEAHGASTIVLTQSEEFGVAITGDEQAKKHISFSLEGDKLVIDEKSNWLERLDRGKYEIHIRLPKLTSFELSGANSTRCTNTFKQDEALFLDLSGAGSIKLDVEAPSLVIDAGGASSIVLKGRVDNFEVDMSGAGSLNAMDLETNNAVISSSGAGSVSVWANQKLKVDASGVGAVKYKGDAQLTKSVSGMASVKKVE